MNIALVHDFVTRRGGAERVLAVLSEMYPKAPIYTLLYDEKKTGAVFPKEKIVASRLQGFPLLLRKNPKYLLPLMPRIIEEWDFSKFDLVISSNSAFTHGILTPTRTQHLCYFHSPMRFAWDWTHEYIKEQRIGAFKKIALAHLLKRLRMWDAAAADRPDIAITNSKNVQRRIKKYYRRESKVIYPPVDTSRFKMSKNSENYFLIISQLTPYKKIELAIELFNRIPHRLVIIGEGPHRNFLQNIASANIEFLGFQSDEKTAEYLQNCRSLIFPGEEDFGITPVEAMASGKPVLAYGAGGVRESVISGVTGEFFAKPEAASMENALARLIKNSDTYSPLKCRLQANKFNKEVFVAAMKKAIKNALKTQEILV